jgi:hypothetical protein
MPRILQQPRKPRKNPRIFAGFMLLKSLAEFAPAAWLSPEPNGSGLRCGTNGYATRGRLSKPTTSPVPAFTKQQYSI